MVPRVAIRAFTCRRDVAPASLLARLLERRGCEVMITSVRDFVRTLKLWKPEVAVFNTPGIAAQIKKHSSETKAVFLDGEGFQTASGSRGLWWKKHPEQYHQTDLGLLWGEQVLKDTRKALPDWDLSKIHVVGNPAVDLVRYLPKEAAYSENSNSIGIATRFNTLNFQSGRSPLSTLPNPGNLDHVLVQCRSFVSLINAIRVLLDRTDFSISIRPHPLEQIETYLDWMENWFGAKNVDRIEIDEALGFSEWVVKQRAVISPTSSSMLDAYFLKVPVINIDRMALTDQFNREHAQVSSEWQTAAASANDLDHLVELVTTGLPKVGHNASLEKQLKDYCDFGNERSSCERAAEMISKVAHDTRRPPGVRWPAWVVDAIDAASFWRACRRNPLHPNMNYRRGYHPLPAHLDAIERNIISKKTGQAGDSEVRGYSAKKTGAA